MAQVNCPLYTTIPKELRDLIWEFALTDCTSNPPDRGRNQQDPNRSSGLYPSDIAFSLLQTCRAVYLETYTLPLSLNPYTTLDLSSNAVTKSLLPWQFAYIQGLDITLPQIALEGNSLSDYIVRKGVWCPVARHKGVYVAPLSYKVSPERPRIDSKHLQPSVSFMLLNADIDVPTKRLTDALRDASPRWHHRSGSNAPQSTAMRVTLARPLTHLTLRLKHTDWWTWTDAPNSIEGHRQLGLDPAVGDGSAKPDLRPTSDRMRHFADERRAGRNPATGSHQSGWGSALIGQLPDLKTLELVLETFSRKQTQLENVIECAKTWRFPIDGTQFELVWDGQVEKKSWSKPRGFSPGSIQYGPWYTNCTNYEVRIVRFTRRRAA